MSNHLPFIPLQLYNIKYLFEGLYKKKQRVNNVWTDLIIAKLKKC